MNNSEITKTIQKNSLVILSGILGIVVFLNTALAQLVTLMDFEEVELDMIMYGIGLFSFILLLISFFFFIPILPIEEVVFSLKKLFRKKVESVEIMFVFYTRLIIYVLGVFFFTLVFLFFMIRFTISFI